MEQSTHEIRLKEWSKIIQDCYTSGLTQKEWCMQNHINEKSFYYWQRVDTERDTCKMSVAIIRCSDNICGTSISKAFC